MRARADDVKILAEYEKWDPSRETVDEFAVRIGTSKPTLYTVLKRNDVAPKLRRPQRTGGDTVVTSVGDPLLRSMGEQALKVMLEQLTEQAVKIAELEEKLEQRTSPEDQRRLFDLEEASKEARVSQDEKAARIAQLEREAAQREKRVKALERQIDRLKRS